MDQFFEALEEEELREEEEKEESEFMRVIKEAKEKEEEARTGENTRLNASTQRKRVINGSQRTSSDEDEDASPKASNMTSKTKKAVKFAGVEDEEDEKDANTTSKWGDVQQGRLRKPIASGGDTMKLKIVERFPSNSKKPLVDSDDDDEEDGFSEGDDEEERRQIEMEDALQQREIALRYHELRHSLGTGPTGGALGGSIEPSMIDEWDQEVR